MSTELRFVQSQNIILLALFLQSNPTRSNPHRFMVYLNMANRNNGIKSVGRDAASRFAAGNPGRPPGTRHKTTRAALALLEGEAEGLSHKAVEMALNGDTTALRLCLERIAPAKKDTPVQFDLPPMKSAADAARAAGAVLDAVALGDLTPTEGSHIMGLIEGFRRTLETTELEARVVALEEAN